MSAFGHHLRSWYPLLHLGTYQVTWLVALVGGAALSAWPGLLAGGLMLALHVALSAPRGAVLVRLVVAAVIGIVIDALLMASGTVGFAGTTGMLPPAWMVILWPCFASLFDDLLAWLPRRPGLAILCGALGGPLAYFGGLKLDAVVFPMGLAAGLPVIAIAWAIATAALIMLWRTQSPAPQVAP